MSFPRGQRTDSNFPIKWNAEIGKIERKVSRLGFSRNRAGREAKVTAMQNELDRLYDRISSSTEPPSSSYRRTPRPSRYVPNVRVYDSDEDDEDDEDVNNNNFNNNVNDAAIYTRIQLRNYILQTKLFANLYKNPEIRQDVINHIVLGIAFVGVLTDHHCPTTEDMIIRLMNLFDKWRHQKCEEPCPRRSGELQKLINYLSTYVLRFMYKPDHDHMEQNERALNERLAIDGVVGTTHMLYTDERRKTICTLLVDDKIYLMGDEGSRRKGAIRQLFLTSKVETVQGLYASTQKFSARYPSVFVKTTNTAIHLENRLSMYWLRRLSRRCHTDEDVKVYKAFVAIYNMMMMVIDEVIK